MQKNINKKAASVSHVVLGQAALTDPVPTEKAPTPPDYVPVKVGRGRAMLRSQVTMAPKVATELRGYAQYKEVFGATASDADTVAAALETASAWSASLANAAAWFKYVQQEAALAWQHARGLTDTLRAPFDIAVARDATVAETLPSTARFFGDPKAIAQRAVATKKKNKAAKTGSAPAAAPAPAVTAAGSKAVN
jgi:hypothetical protein